ncbi:hypothetical protein D3C71_2072300 [compost metagenome]
MDDEQAPFLGLGGEDLVARCLLFLHLLSMIGITLRLGHEVGFLEELFGQVGHGVSSR